MKGKYGVREVMSLMVYDENGNFVTNLDTLEDSFIKLDESGKAFLLVKDALLDFKLLSFINGKSTNNKSDFDNLINQATNKTITFKTNKDKKPCKLIAKSVVRNARGDDERILYEIPLARIGNAFECHTDHNEPTAFDILFDIEPNSQDELFKMHIL